MKVPDSEPRVWFLFRAGTTHIAVKRFCGRYTRCKHVKRAVGVACLYHWWNELSLIGKNFITKAGVHKFRLRGRVGNNLCSGAWYLWGHGIELALCHASGAQNFEVVPIFEGNLHTHEQQAFDQYIYFFFDVCLETVASAELPMCSLI